MGMTKERKSYPSDVSDEEWALCAPYLTLMKEDAPQRTHALRALFNGLRWFVRAGCFASLAEDMRVLLRLTAGRQDAPTAAILDSRTLQSTPESGGRATTEPRNARAAKSMRRWTRWATCWR